MKYNMKYNVLERTKNNSSDDHEHKRVAEDYKGAKEDSIRIPKCFIFI